MKKTAVFSGLLLVLLLIFFEWVSLQSAPFRFFFGSPSLVVQSLWSGIQAGVFVRDLLVTGIETSLGFALGVFFGTIVGFGLWFFPRVARVLSPYVFVAGVIPVVVLAPMIIIWFGIGVTMKIALAGFATFLVALNQAFDGAQSVRLEEYRFLELWGATRIQWLLKVVFPSALDWVFSSLRLNIGFALLGTIIGEFIAGSVGLGHAMFLAGSLYDMPGVLAGAIGLVLLALVLQGVVRLIEKSRLFLIRWISIDARVANQN